MRHWLQAPFLLGIWLLLSGKFDAFHIGTGVFAVLFVVWLDRKLGPANLEKREHPLRVNLWRGLAYVPWLIWQMLVSSWQVARVILSPKMPLQPALVRFISIQPHAIARVVLGNSITLTPGTLTLDIEGDSYLVHSLTDASAEGLLDGGMQRRVARLFGSEGEGAVSGGEIVRGRIRTGAGA